MPDVLMFRHSRGHIASHPGIIDVAGYDFNHHGPVPLNFNWEFYWQQLLAPGDFRTGRPGITGYIKVPGVWNGYNTGSGIACGDGYATYRLHIKNLPAGNHGLKLPSMATAYRLWVNDIELASNGKVTTGPDMKPQQLPLAVFFETGGKDVVITIQVSNYLSDKGGIWEKILLGTEEQILKKRILGIAFDLMLFGSILIMSLYHFALYFFRKNTVFTLYFGLVCLVISLRILITGEFFLIYLEPGIDWSIEIKTEFITVYGGFTFFLLFLKSLYGREFSSRVVRLFVISSLVFFLFTLFFSVKTTAILLPVYHGIIVAGFLYMLYALVLAIISGREGAPYILAGCLILTIVVVNDILDSNEVINSGYLFPVGLLIFIFSQSVILARIFSSSVRRVEELSGQLRESYNRIDEYNRDLESMIAERTMELAAANKKLRDLDRAKTDFFANVSHELRTPLTLILAPVEEALAGKPMDRDYLELIHRSGRNLLSLINDLLEVSRITSGNIMLDVTEIDFCKLLRDCCAGMESTAKLKGITLSCYTPDSGMPVWIDRKKIANVMSNMFSNSFKFTAPGGKIELSCRADKDDVVVRFADTGCGIPAGKIPVIFDRFVQADTGTARSGEGTGIGLSLVRDIVELHGGSVQVESRYVDDYPGAHGSAFILRIPAGKNHLEGRSDVIFIGDDHLADDVHCVGSGLLPYVRGVNPPAADEASVMAGTCTDESDLPAVLVVEDNSDLRNLVAGMLAGSYVVYAVSDGREAISVFESGVEVDLVLSDIMMPGMDGHALLMWMRGSEKFSGIPFVFLTARADSFMKIEGLQLGAVDYVTKPFNSDELLLRVRNQMEHKKMRNILRRNYNRLLAKLRDGVNDHTVTGDPVNTPGSHDTRNSSRMEQVCAFINEHYTEEITRDDLAAVLNLNPDTFSRLFNQHTGTSLNDYVSRLRIEEAKKRLTGTDDPVTRISLDAGFDSIRTFNRAFKKLTGISPVEYRERGAVKN